MFAPRCGEEVERFFRGLTENAFLGELGVVDPPLIEYVATLLVRCLRADVLPALPGRYPGDREEPAELVESFPRVAAETALADYRRIGDSTLFWVGLYPEALRRFQPLDYRAVGRRAYWLASTLEPADAAAERMLLERLSSEFDVCAAGLAEVRRAWNAA